MKILTYNLWDSSAGMPERAEHIQKTLTERKADILCLQEVPDRETACRIAEACSCPTLLHDPVSGCAVLAKLHSAAVWHHPYAIGILLRAGEKNIQAVSVHLPWNSACARETAAAEIVQAAESKNAGYTVLAGDFNSSDTSDVHRYLTGDCAIGNSDAYYFDLALSRQANTGETPLPTLDFRRNPRWGTAEPVNTIEIPQRCDRIYLKNPYPEAMPVLSDCGIFGTESHPVTGLCPSDHYGVYAVLHFPESI